MPSAKVVKPLFKAPQRYPNGVGTVIRNNYNDKLGYPEPSQWISDNCDFVNGDLAAKWAAVLVVGTGTAAQLAGNGGLVTIVNSAANNDKTSLVKTAATGQNFTMATNRMLFAEVSAAADDATLAHWGAGLTLTATDIFTYVTGVTFRKTAGAANTYVFEVKLSGQTTITNSVTGPTSVAATQTKLGIAYTGKAFNVAGVTNFEFVGMVDVNDGNGQRQFSFLVPSTSFPTGNLMPTVGVLNSTAVARTLNVDYMNVAQERFFS